MHSSPHKSLDVALRHRFRLDISGEWSVVRWMGKGVRDDRTVGKCEDLKSRLSLQIARIASLGKDDLRAAWSAEYRKPPPAGLTRDLLVRTLGWRLQEKAFGGHDQATVKLLDAYARGKGNGALFHKLKSGTVLVREYRGARHTVTIVEGGFLWQERKYPNLSAIARAITGTNWNGPRFFGLRQVGRSRAKKAIGDLQARAQEVGQVTEHGMVDANG